MRPSLSRWILIGVLAGTAIDATAQSAPARQDLTALRAAVTSFLTVQAGGLPGQITVDVGALDPRLNLSACVAVEPFLPNGSRAWGKTSVGMRCTTPAPWTVYIPAVVHVMGDYLAATRPLAQGQVVSAGDIVTVKGDLTTLPPGIVTEQTQAVGYTVTRNMAVGAPLRMDALRGQIAVTQGQKVRLVSNGPGFSVSAEGTALSNGSDGQMVQVRTPSGVASGMARLGGTVEVPF